MTNRAFSCFALLVTGVFACSSEGDDGASGSGGSGRVDAEFPAETTQAGVEAFLDGGSYRASHWIFDAAPRRSIDTTSPHGRVRVYFNSVAAVCTCFCSLRSSSSSISRLMSALTSLT